MYVNNVKVFGKYSMIIMWKYLNVYVKNMKVCE